MPGDGLMALTVAQLISLLRANDMKVETLAWPNPTQLSACLASTSWCTPRGVHACVCLDIGGEGSVGRTLAKSKH